MLSGTCLAVVISRLVHGASALQALGSAGRRPRARRDDHRAARLEHLLADPHPALADDLAAAAQQRHAAVLEPRHLARVVEVVDHLVAAVEHPLHGELALRGLRGARDPARLREHLGRSQQRLGRHARVERALAAHELALDDRHAQPASARRPAITSPAGPAPITTTS